MKFPLLILASAVTVLQVEADIAFAPCPDINKLISQELVGALLPPFHCANVTVPLDYTDDAAGNLALSVFRVNATAQPVLGTVLMNFGGPGGTAAENLPAFATKAHHIIGPQWNLVSWDPRGTGYTLPFQCEVGTTLTTPTSPNKRDLHLVSTKSDGGVSQFRMGLCRRPGR